MARLRLHYGKIIAIEPFPRLGMVKVSFDLDFGLSLVKPIYIEGFTASNINSEDREKIKHCMIVLLVGKSVTITSEQKDGRTYGRIYLTDRIKTPPIADGVYVAPRSCDEKMLAVGPFLRWLEGKNYKVSIVREVLNGRYNNG